MGLHWRKVQKWAFGRDWSFKAAVIGLFLLGLGLRFWRLGDPQQLVFDEVYYAKFANDYLIGREFFNSHPPLSQYFIALGIWLGSLLLPSSDAFPNLNGLLPSPWSYRWMNALLGSFIAPVIGAIAFQLSRRRSMALIAMALVTLEGLFLVESRYALNNIYLLLFGLLGQYFCLRSLRGDRRSLPWAGLCFGLSAAAKWNGLGFLLGILAWWVITRIRARLSRFMPSLRPPSSDSLTCALETLSPSAIALNLLLVPAIAYSLAWIPHLWLNPQFNFWEVHQQILNFHHKIGNGRAVHPYCSPWYSWLLMVRPVAYFYQTQRMGATTLVRDIHGMGNPLLWWFATAAMAATCTEWLATISKNWRKNWRGDRPLRSEQSAIAGYLTINFGANLLPWLEINRCTFLYHYLASYSFALLGLAWWLDRALSSSNLRHRELAIASLTLMAIAFCYWLPIYKGLPLSEGAFQRRMWFRSWI